MIGKFVIFALALVLISYHHVQSIIFPFGPLGKLESQAREQLSSKLEPSIRSLLGIKNYDQYMLEHNLIPKVRGNEAKLAAKKQVNPVVLIPGDGGSQLVAKLNKTSVIHYYCYKTTDYWFTLWVNLEDLLPYTIGCFSDNMVTLWDNKTNLASNNTGVQIRIAGQFGDSTTVEWLDPQKWSATHYFYAIAQSLVENSGGRYKRGVNIFGAAYDFRISVKQSGDYLNNLTALVESAYVSNNNTRVYLVAHSMGNLFTKYLLSKKSQAWKDKYVEGFISISSPWQGAIKTIKVTASGDNEGIFLFPPIDLRPAQRSWPSLYSLFPSFVDKSKIMVQTASKNYTFGDMNEFFVDIGSNQSISLYANNFEDFHQAVSQPPNVKTYCLYGVGVPTEEAYIYKKGAFPDSQPEIISGEGDGTVNLESAKFCEKWKSQQNQVVEMKSIAKADHLGILSNADAIQYVNSIVGIA